MRVCVVGLWHLGTVIAACLASGGHDVTGLDSDPAVIERLGGGRPPILEPGLEDLLKTGLAGDRLRFTTDAAAALTTRQVREIDRRVGGSGGGHQPALASAAGSTSECSRSIASARTRKYANVPRFSRSSRPASRSCLRW